MRQLKIRKSITTRDGISLEKYFGDINREGILSPEEEAVLSKRIREGDTKAMDKLVCANLRFVISVAKQYQHQGLSLQDLISEGNIGLIKAAEKYDERKGFKFISYAVWWIRQSIMLSIAEHARFIRLPINQIGEINKIYKIMNRFEMENERKPSVEELEKISEFPGNKIKKIIEASSFTVSLDEKKDEEEDDMISYLPNRESPLPDSIMIKDSLSREVFRIISFLPQKEGEILKMFFGIGQSKKTLQEISETINLSRERVRQLKDKALKRLRYKSKRRFLKDCME